MPDPEAQEPTAADIARATAVRAAVTMGVELAVLLAVMLVSQHQDAIAQRWRGLRALAARRAAAGLPADAGLRVGDFARTVSAYDHGDRA
jgi:hypothetical protein